MSTHADDVKKAEEANLDAKIKEVSVDAETKRSEQEQPLAAPAVDAQPTVTEEESIPPPPFRPRGAKAKPSATGAGSSYSRPR